MFFDEYCKQCNRVGKAPTACALEMGFHRSEVTRWKNGTVPRRANLLRIADYFGVPMSVFTEEKNRELVENKLSDAQQMLIDLIPSLSDDTISMLLILAKQLSVRGKSQDE